MVVTCSSDISTIRRSINFYFLSRCIECRIHFLWRPHLPDPKDDLILELALAGNAAFIITHHTRDFQSVAALGIQVVTPDDFLSTLPTA